MVTQSTIKVRVPELGDGIEKAVLACWHVKDGDRVTKGDDVVELVTDKASFNVAADSSGILKYVITELEKEVNIGDVLAVIEETRS